MPYTHTAHLGASSFINPPPIHPKPITASDLALLRGMARAITDNELAQPMLDVPGVAVESLSKVECVDRGNDE